MQRRSFLIAACAYGAHPLSLARAEGDAKKSAAAYERMVLRDFDDAVTSLRKQAEGQILVVVVMKGHWCHVCLGQLKRLTDLKARLKGFGATVVGLNADTVRANKAAAHAMGIEFPILSDSKHAVISDLGLWLDDAEHPMPAIVVFDRCGREARRFVGRRPGQRLEPALLQLLETLSREGCGKPNA